MLFIKVKRPSKGRFTDFKLYSLFQNLAGTNRFTFILKNALCGNGTDNDNAADNGEDTGTLAVKYQYPQGIQKWFKRADQAARQRRAVIGRQSQQYVRNTDLDNAEDNDGYNGGGRYRPFGKEDKRNTDERRQHLPEKYAAHLFRFIRPADRHVHAGHKNACQHRDEISRQVPVMQTADKENGDTAKRQ